MRMGFYSRLGISNIKKNNKIYLPYILSSVGMVMMFYIVTDLANDREVASFAEGGTLQIILKLGMIVIGIFSVILLFYTNSFLIKRRKTELGLYNVLGMGKAHIARVLWWENLVVAIVSIVGGLVAGAVFSKIFQVCLIRMMGYGISYTFRIGIKDMTITGIFFAGVFLLIYLNSVRQVCASKTIELLYSSTQGEKEPKANFIIAALGIILLGAGYYIAVTVDNPLTAIIFFFVAVILVILGTYGCFISGSVAALKLLRKNKKYYYKTNNFISTSSMIFRMKRNGAGLASICILSTMVLVMLSSTACMYFGADNAMEKRYPRELEYEYNLRGTNEQTLETSTDLISTNVNGVLSHNNAEGENVASYRMCKLYCIKDSDGIQTTEENYASGDVFHIVVIPLYDFNKTNGTHFKLNKNQVLIRSVNYVYDDETIKIGGKQYDTVIIDDDILIRGSDILSMDSCFYMIVPEAQDMYDLYRNAEKSLKNTAVLGYYYAFDVNKNRDVIEKIYNEINESDISNLYKSDFSPKYSSASMVCNCREMEKIGFYSVYGGMFFLGIILSITFLLATVMMMYYKQVTEGYDDKGRFDILQKVGMTKGEIKKSINSQVLTVFFVPLIVAGLHIAFAFPMIALMLKAFGINNKNFLALTTLGALLIFAVFYIIVYIATSKAYYRIVSSSR